MLNKAILMGRLVADPELRYTPNNVAVMRFRIAVDRNFTPQGGERKADFFDVSVWRQTAEFVSKYFRKGSWITVEGEIHNDQYTDREGKTQYRIEIAADRVYFTGDKSNNQGGYQQGGYQQQRSDFAPPAYTQPQQSAPQGGYQQPAPQPMQPVQQPSQSFAVGQGGEFTEVADDVDLPF